MERNRSASRRRSRKLLEKALAAGTSAAISLAALQGTAGATPPPGAQLLEDNVDALVQEFMADTGLPGTTVAVSKQGRLLLSKGYGSAMVDGDTELPMKASTRTSIGSVSKAAVTGPAAWRLLEKLGIDPATKTLYGPNGLFGAQFDADIDQGIAASYPDSANWKQWYQKITVQDLFDHTSGFQRDASKSEAAQMFDVSENELTREQYHRFFLRTGKLLHEPGSAYAYSNHGFGLFALVIEKLTGKDFYEHVRDEHLKPMELHNGIQGSREHPDSCDSHNHAFTNGLNSPVEVLAFNESRLGLAQGGFRSSAQDLALVMKNLEQSHEWDEIDRMGWFNNGKGRLDHNGKLDGGTASVVMFPEGYTSSGKDLSGVQVAVATNIRLDGVDIDYFARTIALSVPASNVEPTHDLWPQVLASRSCEYSRHGVPLQEYQSLFDKATKQDYQLDWIDGFTVAGQVFFNVVFRAPASGAWVSHQYLTGTSYQDKLETYGAAGYSAVHVDSFPVGTGVRYAAIWRKNAGLVAGYHGKLVTEHQNLFDTWTADGWRPKVISVASVNGTRYYTALYTKQYIGSFVARSFLTPAQYQTEYDENKAAGRRLRYVNAYLHNGQVRFTAIWSSKPDVVALKASHGITADQYDLAWKKNASASYRTGAVTGYEQGGQATYAAFWLK